MKDPYVLSDGTLKNKLGIVDSAKKSKSYFCSLFYIDF